MRAHLHGRLGPAIRRAAAVSAQARATGAPVDEVAGRMAADGADPETRFGRRTLFKGMASVGAVAAEAQATRLRKGTAYESAMEEAEQALKAMRMQEKNRRSEDDFDT